MKKVLLTESEYRKVNCVLNEDSSSKALLTKEELKEWNERCDVNFKLFNANELFYELKKICGCKTSMEYYCIKLSICYSLGLPYNWFKHYSMSDDFSQMDDLFYINHEGGDAYSFTKVDQEFAEFIREELNSDDPKLLIH